MVTTPHRLASEAGAAVLARGGNAIEAAVAAGAVLCVVYPHFCGIGGDGVWMVADRSGRATSFLGIGQAASILPPDDPIPVRGGSAALTSAALVDSWQHALDHSARHWNGRASMASLLEPAIALAAEGHPVSPSQRFWLAFRATQTPAWPGFDAVFADRGAVLRQPRLAESLRAVADLGSREFYEGALARRIAAGLAEAGSPLTARDLAATRTRSAEPLRQFYRGFELLAPPPPTQGATTLAIMGILGHFDLAGLDPSGADFVHLCVEAVKRAFLDRGGIADPDFGAAAPDLAPETLRAKATSIDRRRAMAWPATFQTGDTAFVGVVDGEGRSVALLQSLYFDWGSGVVAGDTGILWQNRGAAFDRSPDGPNRLQPGKRPFYSLNPGIALRDGRPRLVYGTQGADGQPQTLATILCRAIDFGLDPLSALSAPRFLLGRTFSDTRDALKLEADIGEAACLDLASRGHEVSVIPAQSPLAGQPGLIVIDEAGNLAGAHDPRSDGFAIPA